MSVLWKVFKKPSLEGSLDRDYIEKKLLITEPEEAEKEETIEIKKPKKKKTATTIHLEIKETLENSPDLAGHEKADSLLKQAFKDGFKGKRLQTWDSYLSNYFDSILQTEIEMSSSVKTAYGDYQKNEKETLPFELKSSTMLEPQEETLDMIDLPDLPLDDLEDAATEVEDLSLEDKSGGAVVFGILGAGQAGGRIAESFYKLGYKKALAVNTAEHDLNGLADLPEAQKIIMSTGADSAGGAGKDMRKGEAAADNHQQEIYEKMQTLFGKVDRILVCAGSGGGSGAGACLRLVETAKKYLQYLGVENVNTKVGVLLTLPTAGEAASPTIADNAHLIATKLSDLAEEGQISPLIMFDNDKIKKMYPNLTVRKFWPTVNAWSAR